MAELYPNWLNADRTFWRNLEGTRNFTVWDHDVTGKVWGLGGGDSPNGGYNTQSITDNVDDNTDLTFSTQIMAGFLGTSAQDDAEINADLQYLYDNDVCAYTHAGSGAKVLCRCSKLIDLEPSYATGRRG